MRKILLSLPLWGLWAPSTGFAGKHAIVGQIIDRRGEPLEEATVTLVGRNAAMPTDENGWFRIDYLRTNDGKQTRLDKRTTYVVNITMVGFHETELEVTYKRGEPQAGTDRADARDGGGARHASPAPEGRRSPHWQRQRRRPGRPLTGYPLHARKR